MNTQTMRQHRLFVEPVAVGRREARGKCSIDIQYLWGTRKEFYQRRQCESDVIAACLKYFFRSDEEFAVGEMQKAADGGGGCDHETDGGRTDGRTDGWMELQIPARDKRDDSFADKTGGRAAKQAPNSSSLCRPTLLPVARPSLALWQTLGLLLFLPLPGQILRRRVDSYGKATPPDVNVTSSAPRI